MSRLARFLSRRTLLVDRFLWTSAPLLGADVNEVEFAASDGSRLRGWLIAGTLPGCIVFCCGNSGNVSAHSEYLRLAASTGRSVLGFDYRGFGRSDGVADLRYLVDDVISACDFVRESRGLTEPLALFGISLGAGSALAAAAQLASREDRPGVSAVVVEGLSDLYEMLSGLFSRGRFGPVRAERVAGTNGEGFARERLRLGRARLPRFLARTLAWRACRSYPFSGKRPVDLVDQLESVPVLVVHGVDDELLPFEAAVDLYEALRGEKRLWLIPHTGHAQEPALSHREEYVFQIDRFLGEAAGEPRSDARRLETALEKTLLRQDVAFAGDGGAGAVSSGSAGFRDSLDVSTLDVDGFPTRELDSRSWSYRHDGYRDVFRRLVRSINQRDFERLDEDLGCYLELPRALPFDLLASMYAFRVALGSRRRLPGWPTPSPAVARRSSGRFIELWEPHEELHAIDDPASPLVWLRSRLEPMT